MLVLVHRSTPVDRRHAQARVCALSTAKDDAQITLRPASVPTSYVSRWTAHDAVSSDRAIFGQTS
jgi:nitroimidazol reductase NimA-like FMN-containing flavoprotein (pyridoxamine 5'-phosphate oxidase superfamily)